MSESFFYILLIILKKYLQIGQVYDRIMTVREVHMIYARVAQLVEYDLAKVGVAGSSPVSRSFYFLDGMRISGFRGSASCLLRVWRRRFFHEKGVL